MMNLIGKEINLVDLNEILEQKGFYLIDEENLEEILKDEYVRITKEDETEDFIIKFETSIKASDEESLFASYIIIKNIEKF